MARRARTHGRADDRRRRRARGPITGAPGPLAKACGPLAKACGPLAKACGPLAKAGGAGALSVLLSSAALGALLGPALVASVVLGARAASADPIDDARNRFVESDPSAWPARLAELSKEPGRLGAVVGPLLRDRDARRAKAGAFAGAWLCDHPQASGRIPLEDDVLRRAARDAAFVADLRGFLATDGAGWPRLLGAARDLVGATGADAALVSAAVWLRRYEATASNARELLEVWEQADDASVRATAEDSLAALLGTAFGSATEARRFFDANRGRSFYEWVRDLSAAKDRPDAPLYHRLLEEVRLNLAHAQGADELRRYLLLVEAPWPEVRRLAAERAAELAAPSGVDSGAWVRLFVEAVAAEPDVETLSTVLDAFGRLGYQTNGESRSLAARTADRLEERPPPVDALAVRFLAILGSLGTPADLHRVFGTLLERRASPAVLTAWLDAAASSGGCGPDVRELHRRRRAATGPEDVALRVRALEALAKGIAASPAEVADEARQSGAFLVEVLESTAASDAAIGPGIEERSAAARGLEAFPSAAAVAALEARALDATEDLGLARLCASVLGRLAAKGAEGDDALRALVRVAGGSGTAAARVSAIDDLSRLAREETSDERRRLLVGGLCDALGVSAPSEVRRAAARAAALAGDARALHGVFALVAEDLEAGGAAPTGPDSGLWSADRLVRAVVARADDADEELARECRDLLDQGPSAAGAAVALAESAADAGGGRPALQRLRAMLLRRRAESAGRSLDEGVDDLELARRVLTSALRGASEADLGQPEWQRVAAFDDYIVTMLLRRRVRQLTSVPKGTEHDARRLSIRRGLEPALRSALEVGSTSRAVEAALAADDVALERLRGSESGEIRRAARIDSARAELRRGDGVAANARARALLAEAKALGPTAEELAEIARIEASLVAADKTAPAPR